MKTYKGPTALGRAAVRGQKKTAGIGSWLVDYVTDPALLKQTILGLGATYAAARPGLAHLGDWLSRRKPILKVLKGPEVANASPTAGEALAGATVRRVLTGAAKPIPVHSAPVYTPKGIGQRLKSWVSRDVDLKYTGHNKPQAFANMKVAPVESLWPGEVARGVGFGTLRQDAASRLSNVQELQAALADLPVLTHNNRTFKYLDSAVNSLASNKDLLAKVPVGDYGQPGSKASDAFWRLLPTGFWGTTTGSPHSGMEKLVELRTHGNAADRIRKTMESVSQGKAVTKPNALWAAAGTLSYRRQLEDAAEAFAKELKEGDPMKVRRLGRALVNTMHPTHYLHELGRQLVSQPPPIPAAALKK